RRERQRIRSDLVRRVAVPRDPVGADHHAPHLAGGEERGGRHVRQQRDRDAVLEQFPRSETRALEPGPRLVGIHGALLPGPPRSAASAARISRSGAAALADSRAASARPYAAAPPMAGAPRTTTSRMAWAASEALRTRTSSTCPGSFR